MSPLTLRMSDNFDFYNFKFKMGHSYELTMPRTAHEWGTLMTIQRDFPSASGILMPLMIMMTGASSGNGTSWAPVDGQPLDVATQDAFNINCQMADALIAATKGKPWAIGENNMLSATFHGFDESENKVKCMHAWQLDFVRKNYISTHFLLSHTSKHLREMWDQVVSAHEHAMLTFVFPQMDPFSPKAFKLVTDVRAALEVQTQIIRQTHPGVTFLAFSPGSVLLDLIDVTSGQLPICFIGCAVVCLTLIALWFGSALIPFKLLLTVVVPITWTYGAGLYVYEDGCLNFLNFPGLGTTRDAGIDWTVPMFTLTFMMGLALDYEIFLFERVREFREEGFGDKEAIQLGLAATGGTISSAGLIMALTFLAQLLGSIPVTNQIGFILVFSIVVDTFVVRSILVPAMLSLWPCTNYWPSEMPPVLYEWLETDVAHSARSRDGAYKAQQDEEEDDDDDF
uniref:Membrane transport protein MMPL domain-containing protein n=1 Tax=Zooxanthella nutricula TaxID=1333877 RepID=A0A7S2NK97_9DINO